MATVTSGYMLGHEDVIKNRNYTTSVVCLSKSSKLYSIEKDEFIVRMKRNANTWEEIIESSQIKD